MSHEEKAGCLGAEIPPTTPPVAATQAVPEVVQAVAVAPKPTAVSKPTGLLGWVTRTIDAISEGSDKLDERWGISKSCQEVGDAVVATASRGGELAVKSLQSIEKKSDQLDEHYKITPRAQQVGDMAVGAGGAVLAVPAKLVVKVAGTSPGTAPADTNAAARSTSTLPAVRESAGGTTLRTVAQGTVTQPDDSAPAEPVQADNIELAVLPPAGSTAI